MWRFPRLWRTFSEKRKYRGVKGLLTWLQERYGKHTNLLNYSFLIFLKYMLSMCCYGTTMAFRDRTTFLHSTHLPVEIIIFAYFFTFSSVYRLACLAAFQIGQIGPSKLSSIDLTAIQIWMSRLSIFF